MSKIHPQIWTFIVKSYNHAHGGEDYLIDLLDHLTLTKKFNILDEYSVEYSLGRFLKSLSYADSLLVIKDALEDDEIKKMDKNDWNYYGDYVKEWRGKIIEYLKKSGIKFDDKTKQFYEAGHRLDIMGSFTTRKEVISSVFDDGFYDNLKNEINSSYRHKIFTATFMLSRKMIENLLIDILRLKFPPKDKQNLELYFRKKDGRFHDFLIILKNLENKKNDFGIDKHIIEEFISLIKPFRLKANSKAHSIIMIGEEKEVLNAKIEKMIELLLKLKNNLVNDLRQ